AGIKQSQFVRVAGIADQPYNGSYVSAVDSSTRWWKTTSDGIKDKLDVTLFSEDIEEESIDDLDEPDNFDDSKVEHQNLEIKDLIMLNNFDVERLF
ncbi:16933_t:CDS:2, partial [Dentiscutata heterogama]